MAERRINQPSSVSFSALLLGFSSLLAQTVIIRALLSVFSGNELIIGIVLGMWILFVALGSMLSELLKADTSVLSLSFLSSGWLLQIVTSSAWYVYPVAGLSFGEVIPLHITLLYLLFLMAPVCLLFGAEFPLIVRLFKTPPSVVYGLESLGAFFAGAVFSLFMAGYIPDRLTAFGVSMLLSFAALWFLKKRWAAGLLVIPLLLYLSLPDSIGSVLKGRVLERADSPEGEVIATELSGQKNLYLSGKLCFSIPEPGSEELMSQLPALFKEPRDVLLIGGSPAVIKGFSEYRSRVTYLQLNRHLLSISLRMLSSKDRRTILKRPFTEIVNADARAYLKSTNQLFDIIVLNEPFPSTASLNRYYTLEFFNLLKAHLKDGGFLFLRLMAVPGYMGDEMLIADSSIFQTLNRVFPHVKVTSMEYALLIASNRAFDASSLSLKKRFEERHPHTLYLNSSVIEDMFFREKSQRFQRLLKSQSSEINTDRHPVSYLYNVVLWTETQGGRWLAFVVKNRRAFLVLLVLTVLFFMFYTGKRREGPACVVIFSTGFTTLSLVTLSVFLYQSAAGHIYRMIGLMGALYMLGSATGALLAKRKVEKRGVLPLFILAMIALLLLYPLVAYRASIIFGSVFVFGVMGGGLFTLCAFRIKRAALTYSLDLTGALFGAFLTTVFLFPLFGLYYTTGFLVYLNTLSLIVLWMYQTKRA